MDLSQWIAEYEAFLQNNGYDERAISRRRKHLSCLKRFLASLSLKSIEEFGPEQNRHFVDYWIRHSLRVKTNRKPNRRKYRFQPNHHHAVQQSLRSFFRWARSAGLVKREIFPWKAPVRGKYFSPETAAYLQFCRDHKGLAENSLAQIELFVRRFDQYLHSKQLSQWNQIQVHHIDNFVRQQAGKNIKRIHRVQKVLRGLFRFLFSLGLLNRDWASALHAPRQYRLAHVPRAMPPDQVLQLLRSIDRGRRGGKRDFAMVLMAASLGVRASEIASLRLEDLNWRKAAVRYEQRKNRKILWLPLSRPLIEALASYLENERPQNSAQRTVFLRLNAPWGALTPRALAGVISKRMRAAGITASGHCLRHGFASELLRVGVNFSTLQELLGHSHISSTQIYTKIDLVQLREVAENDAEYY
jgi:site-specific recombinase XerD